MKKVLLMAGIAALSVSTSFAQQKTTTKTASKTTTQTKKMEYTPKTNAEKVSYSLGVSIATNLQSQGFDSLDTKALTHGFDDVLKKNGLQISEEQANTIIQEYMMRAKTAKASTNVEAGKKFLEENAKKAGVVTLPSGLQYQVITEGTGPIPAATDKVTTHYHGTLIDGTVFDSSYERGQPASFPVNGVIQGWQEALQLMKVGSKWKLFVPANLAYGERGAGGTIGPNSTLVFDVELISIDK